MPRIKKIIVDDVLEEKLKTQTTSEIITEIIKSSPVTIQELSSLSWISRNTISKWITTENSTKSRFINPPVHVARYLRMCIDNVMLPPKKNKDVIRDMSISDLADLLTDIQKAAQSPKNEYEDMKGFIESESLYKPLFFLSADERKAYIKAACAKSEADRISFERKYPAPEDYLGILSSILKRYTLIYDDLADICMMTDSSIAKYIVGQRNLVPWKIRYIEHCVNDYFKREQRAFSNNYERIRSMTDDELIQFLSHIYGTARNSAIPQELKDCHTFLNGLELLTENPILRSVNDESGRDVL